MVFYNMIGKLNLKKIKMTDLLKKLFDSKKKQLKDNERAQVIKKLVNAGP